jgi:hypothetical protein
MRGHRIVDCGHPNFVAEIHPPTLLARANLDGDRSVRSTLLVLPYRTNQHYEPAGLDFPGQLKGLIAALIAPPPPIPIPPPPLNLLANVDNPPFDRRISAQYRVAIPTVNGRTVAKLNYHFVVRPGVTLLVDRISPYEADVRLILDPATYAAAARPQCDKKVYSLEDADEQAGFPRGKLRGIVNGIAAVPVWPLGLVISVNAGLIVSECNVPGGSVVTPPYDGGSDNQVVVDASQPFPAYGWLSFAWGPPCQPKTRCQAGAQCGSEDDGCHGTVLCGGPCPGGKVCKGHFCVNADVTCLEGCATAREQCRESAQAQCEQTGMNCDAPLRGCDERQRRCVDACPPA